MAVTLLLKYRKSINNEKLIKQETDSDDVEKSTKEIEKVIEKETEKPLDRNKVLKVGSKSDEVKVLQKALKRISVDGNFGEATRKRLYDVLLLDEITLNEYNVLLPKANYVITIRNRGKKVDRKTLYSFELGFLKAWSYAIINNQPFFNFNIATYDTLTGAKTNKSNIFSPLKF
jgi:hypothetical protein